MCGKVLNAHDTHEQTDNTFLNVNKKHKSPDLIPDMDEAFRAGSWR